MKIKHSEDFLIVLISSVFLSGLTFVLVSLWQFGKVTAQGYEAPITLVPAEFPWKSQDSPFSRLNKPKFFKPAFLSAQKIGLVNIPFVEVSLDNKNRLEAPQNFDTVGWFKDGSKPGEPGNAVIDGHYDRKDGSPAIFYKLGKLVKGDLLSIIDERGNSLTFEVFNITLVDVNDPVSAEVAYKDTDTPVITLITCGGVWNAKESNYNKRLLVKAKLI